MKRHLRSERQELYDLLPETMRLALQGPLYQAGEPAGLHLEPEGRVRFRWLSWLGF
jgi:hypothetical protein